MPAAGAVGGVSSAGPQSKSKRSSSVSEFASRPVSAGRSKSSSMSPQRRRMLVHSVRHVVGPRPRRDDDHRDTHAEVIECRLVGAREAGLRRRYVIGEASPTKEERPRHRLRRGAWVSTRGSRYQLRLSVRRRGRGDHGVLLWRCDARPRGGARSCDRPGMDRGVDSYSRMTAPRG